MCKARGAAPMVWRSYILHPVGHLGHLPASTHCQGRSAVMAFGSSLPPLAANDSSAAKGDSTAHLLTRVIGYLGWRGRASWPPAQIGTQLLQKVPGNVWGAVSDLDNLKDGAPPHPGCCTSCFMQITKCHPLVKSTI